MKLAHWLNIVVLSWMVLCVWMSGLLGCATPKPRPSCSEVCAVIDPGDTRMDACLMRCQRRRH